jgi:hypothetical protein
MFSPAKAPSVVAKLSARKHYFAYAVRFAGPHLFHDPVDRDTGFAAAGVGDDAEGAEFIAALLDLDESACAETTPQGCGAPGRWVAPFFEAL